MLKKAKITSSHLDPYLLGEIILVDTKNKTISKYDTIVYPVQKIGSNKWETLHPTHFDILPEEPTILVQGLSNIDPTEPVITLGSLEKKEGGLKNDSQKPDFTDVPLDAMWEMSKAFTYGQKKYSKHNYREGMKVSRLLAASLRHIYQHLDGETVDNESLNMHLGHAMASIAMAIYTLKHYPEMDDRFQKDIEKYQKTIMQEYLDNPKLDTTKE